MTGAQWGTLIPAIVAVLGAAAAYLKSRTASKSAAAAHARLDSLPAAPPAPVTPAVATPTGQQAF